MSEGARIEMGIINGRHVIIDAIASSGLDQSAIIAVVKFERFWSFLTGELTCLREREEDNVFGLHPGRLFVGKT
jgi:hypothetical protein